MATRSTIALEFADGTVQQVYCHWDGYLDHNGRILQAHYMDPFKVRDLIDLGSISSLGAEIGQKHDFDVRFTSGAIGENWTKFYCRDRGEDLTVHQFKDFADYEQNHQYEEYEYILRQEDGQAVWYVCSYDSDGYQPLASLLSKDAA
jgi:hypothetical protein